ncbi:iron uptake transporter deferrochelatase/peroxidase subunit [Lentibacillus sp. Marseille-P4043]|uniref:iron uptake transporter deferrochelatase/peroxidase subunit n=1 Tax=Lentibacillus sp. Marseille-P4043 TaxID=2040293 RepID=UPI000D0B9470|nr:iron uptake transporter deferrochelatase/peroxidase subunit [Lentibacillus sp. Marseille-P4043]
MTNEKKDNEIPDLMEKRFTRRKLLKTAGIGSVGAFIGASGLGGILTLSDVLPASAEKNNSHENGIPFYGEHQAGITTEMQDNVYFASLDVKTSDRAELITLLKDWTKASAAMTKGDPVDDAATNDLLPPVDTGETVGLSMSNLTITFGVGPTLFTKNGKGRFGIQHKKPAELKALPKFSLDALEKKWSGGDLCIQACSDDAQVAFHAVRNLVRIARGKAVLRWAQEGFQRTKKANKKQETPRNLFGFKDGTVNPDVKNKQELNKNVWVQQDDGPNWLTNGSYLVVRRIQMFIEVWDRTTLKGQEETFGRDRKTGAPLGQSQEFEPVDFDKKDENGQYYIPDTAHIRRAHGKGKEELFRRSYSYSDGMDIQTGSFDAGLLFMCYQRNPSKQFVPIQQRLAQIDELNEYIVHRGSAVFACLPGVKKGGFIGDTLFG